MRQIYEGLPDIKETTKLNNNIVKDVDYAFDGTYMYKENWTCSKCLEVIPIDYDICDYCQQKRPQFKINLMNGLGFNKDWVKERTKVKNLGRSRRDQWE